MRENLPMHQLAPVLCVVGARPNFMKMAPILRAFAAADPRLPALLVHTGQHYDAAMSDKLFTDLRLPEPDINLGVGSGTHAVQTAEVMRRFEPVVDQTGPSCVLVVGDVNSTLACSLVAAKKGIPVVHVEAGLRSFDRTMPEEINRVLTDQLADRLYTTEASAHENLKAEGIADERVQFVGNVMIDSLLANRRSAVAAHRTVERHDVHADLNNGYGVVTLHRPSNVDEPKTFKRVVDALCRIAARIPLIFPVHPRTRAVIENTDAGRRLDAAGIILLPPQGYLEMVGLLMDATIVLTDSGGIQEETTALGVPCLTLRDNTERPITVESGTNTLVGRDPERIVQHAMLVLDGGGKRGRVPAGWDGRAAERICKDLASWLRSRAHAARAA